MAVATAKVVKRHAERAAYLWLEVVHGAGEPIRRQPLGQGLALQKSAIDLFGWALEYAVKMNGSVGHVGLLQTMHGYIWRRNTQTGK
jgi:hypothetical protein